MTERPELTTITAGVLAPDVTLHDENGNQVTLSSFWTRQPTALVFVRHFG